MIIDGSSYAPPPFLANGHFQTIYPSLFRRIQGVTYTRERIDTPDGDFLDLDWSAENNGRLAIICHGLEGSSERAYMKGMVKALNRHGWSALAWNYRGCSGEPNRLLRSYHSGATDDLEVVVRYALQTANPMRIALIGFSLGGNLVLKYLGERGASVDARICAGIAFSVPCDLAASARHLSRPLNRIYLYRFLKMLRGKIRRKKHLFPEPVSERSLQKISDFQEFDDQFTAPIHGFRNADEYWYQCSSKRFLADIRVPALLINALNDPFLPAACYPVGEVRGSVWLALETPASGGHVGFPAFNPENLYWSEMRAVNFLDGIVRTGEPELHDGEAPR